MRFDISANASAALEDIAVYIAEGSGFSERAIRFTDELADYCAEVAKVAEVRQVFYVSPHTGIPFRYLPHRDYRIVYAIREDLVIIVDFIRGTQSDATVRRRLDRFAP